MLNRAYDIGVKDTVFDPEMPNSDNPFNVYYKKPKSHEKPLFRVRISLTGKDVPFIKRVKYELHETFSDPVKIVERSFDNPDCGIVIWTWGKFQIEVTAEDHDGNFVVLYHYLSYDDEIREQRKKRSISADSPAKQVTFVDMTRGRS